jgi:glutamyl-tRNA(Gln) amidotransferase subunit E
VLRQFAGLLNRLTQEHTTFAREFSDRIRVIACLTALPNMVHSDTAAEALTARDWKHLRRKTGASESDALILVWGSEHDTRTACEEIAIRAREAAEGIPSDTRQALKDGTNGFERVLPGPQRMYPDTDLPPIEIKTERLERIREQMPPFVWEREARYRAMKLPPDVIAPLCMSPRADLFDRIVDTLGVNPVFTAVVMFQRMKAMRRAGLQTEHLHDDDLFEVFRAHADGRLAREGVPAVIEQMLRIPPPQQTAAERLRATLAKIGMAPLTDGRLPVMLAAAVARLDGSRFATAAKKRRFLAGRVMERAVGCVEGCEVVLLIERRIDAGPDQLASTG